jgi:hypothetical protein
MMQKINLGQTISILANVGVIAGIVFLAVEIGQNHTALEEQNTLTRISGRDAALEYFSSHRRIQLENPELLEMQLRAKSGGTLTDLEKEQFFLLCQDYVFLLLTVYNRFDSLGLDLEREALVRLAGSELSESDADKECWNENRDGLLGRGYGDFIDAVDLAMEQN